MNTSPEPPVGMSSSRGGCVCVGAGVVTFLLGMDTARSGRLPRPVESDLFEKGV